MVGIILGAEDSKISKIEFVFSSMHSPVREINKQTKNYTKIW